MIQRTPRDPLISAIVRIQGETSEEFDPNTVTPGVIGFIITFLVAAVTVLLILDMTRRVRRLRYRSEIAEQLDAEQLDVEQRDAENGAVSADPPQPARNPPATDGEQRLPDDRPPHERG